ncbi:hypothetical protein KKZ03_12380 [Methylobacter sp. S3L5C]|nr:hypothetical protein [Methylobacter sp. S3L5C]UOA07111.1 hypothetical protein KKZ03_12380 [Methylobacter sp. S3L5C]
MADSYSQQDPTFHTSLLYTRLTAAKALEQLTTQGFQADQLPSPSTMAEVLNRNSYRLQTTKGQFLPCLIKRINKPPQLSAIFAHKQKQSITIINHVIFFFRLGCLVGHVFIDILSHSVSFIVSFF